MLSIVMLTCNQIHLTYDCVESLYQHTGAPDRWELCAVDNGSRDQTPVYLQAIERTRGNVRLVLNK
mgnify:FL=1